MLVDLPPDFKADRAVVLTNYRRAANLPRQIEAARALRPAVDIVVIDNAEDQPLSARADVNLEGVHYIRPGRNMGAGHRFMLASRMPHALIACIDDDLFPTPAQIETLFAALAAEPDRVHGYWGENYRNIAGYIWCQAPLHGKARDVDVLNRFYVFTPAHARRAIALAAAVGYPDWYAIGPTDDILVSHGGARRPRCHNVGQMDDCDTSNSDGVAVWRRPGFYEARRAIIRGIRRVRGTRQPSGSVPADPAKEASAPAGVAPAASVEQ